MYEHGFYHLHLKKWYCSYFMDEKEWIEIHDYLPRQVSIDPSLEKEENK